jgi:PKD repeat protein
LAGLAASLYYGGVYMSNEQLKAMIRGGELSVERVFEWFDAAQDADVDDDTYWEWFSFHAQVDYADTELSIGI